MKSPFIETGTNQEPTNIVGEQAPSFKETNQAAYQRVADHLQTIKDDRPFNDFLNNSLKRKNPPAGLWEQIIGKIHDLESNKPFPEKDSSR